MKELTTKNKESLVALLEKHYTIKEKSFIDAIALNEEERVNLTLMAYAIGAEQMNTPANMSTTLAQEDTQVVVIDKLYKKLQFVKVVKEVKGLSLKEAKNLADQLVIYREESSGAFGECYSEPFVIGNSIDSKFTKEQWAEICECLAGNMIWRYA